jgi:hypothetical protein
VYVVAALLGVLQTDREVVVGNGGEGVVAESLEEVRRDRRSEQLDEELAEPRETLDVAHAGTGGSAQ